MAADFSKIHDLSDIQVHPFQSEDQLPMTMALATISLVALDEGAEELMLPSKVFYYMATGSAVVAICRGDNELRDIVEGNECGSCVKTGDPVGLAKTIEELLDNYEKLESFRVNARSAAVEKYSKEGGLNIFVSAFRSTGMIADEL